VVSEGLWALALVAVANAVIGIAVYLRWFALLLQDPGPDSPPLRRPAPGPAAALALTAAALVLTSLAPQLLLGLLD
jgi:NADH-quinone oxidoreductase subunit N